MNYTGWWQNQEHKGEGLMLWTALNGSIAGCWFAPDDGEGGQLWLVVSGTLHESEVGGLTAARVTHTGERKWGEILVGIDGDTLLVDFMPLDGEGQHQYRELTRHPAIHAGTDQPEGPPVKIVNNRGYDMTVPLRSGTKLPSSFTVTALRDVTFGEISTSGPHNPRVEGVREGQALRAGQSVRIVLKVDEGFERQGQHGSPGHAKWTVRLQGFGEILVLDADIAP